MAKLGAVRLALPDYAGEIERLQRQLEEENEAALAEGIAERTEAYISDKAASMGLAGACRVETRAGEDGIPLPWSVELEALCAVSAWVLFSSSSFAIRLFNNCLIVYLITPEKSTGKPA